MSSWTTRTRRPDHRKATEAEGLIAGRRPWPSCCSCRCSPLAEAALFDPQTWELTAREAAREGAADGLAMTFSPMLDVSRDIRWGRTAEGSGEDTWVGVQMARQDLDQAHDRVGQFLRCHRCLQGTKKLFQVRGKDLRHRAWIKFVSPFFHGSEPFRLLKIRPFGL